MTSPAHAAASRSASHRDHLCLPMVDGYDRVSSILSRYQDGPYRDLAWNLIIIRSVLELRQKIVDAAVFITRH
jgi:hypothetical protein